MPMRYFHATLRFKFIFQKMIASFRNGLFRLILFGGTTWKDISFGVQNHFSFTMMFPMNIPDNTLKDILIKNYYNTGGNEVNTSHPVP
jgi:hypothetical protein